MCGVERKKKLRPLERHPTYCALKEFPEVQRKSRISRKITKTAKHFNNI